MIENPTVEIDGRIVGSGSPPYIVAEMSANHGGDLERARRIVELAAKAGADAIKFQAYQPASLTLNSDQPGFVIETDTLWKGRRLYDLYAEAATPYEWFPELFALARELDITPFATPFDRAAVDMLTALDTPAFKIASFEAVDLDLIRACAETGKPIIISTGLCTLDEIEMAVETARAAGATEIVLLRCNSAYPASPEEANLLSIPAMSDRFRLPVGFSDHTTGTTAAVTACALGAVMVEKHVIDARDPPTPDSTFSALPEELTALVTDCRLSATTRGTVHFGPTDRERESIVFRRSLYCCADISAGSAFTTDNVRSVRPGYGLPPKHLPDVLGRIAARDISAGEPLSWDMFT